MKIFQPSVLLLVAVAFSGQAFAALEPSQVMGQGLYEQNGGNSCMFCHGISGEGGNVKEAAKLDLPKTWKTYKALGGDAAYNKDPKGFIEKMKKAVEDLIRLGAIRHNATYKEPGFDWSKITPFNAQMMGLGGAASVAWMKKYQKRGVNAEIAAESLWLHLKSMDKQGVLNK
jgi:cytochrome c553